MENKKVLFIASSYFGYYKNIIEELRELDFQVDCFSDRPTQNNLFKALSRINPKLVKSSVKPYFESILEKTKDTKYDYVFFIRGMSYCFDDAMMTALKQSQPQATFLSYQWDSIINLKDIESFWQYFDRCYSFDRIDTLKHDKLEFLPLFYDRDYEQLGKQKADDFEYDCCYIGTAHPKKFKLINEMSQKLQGVYDKQFIYHYMPSKLKFFYHKLKNPEYKNAKLDDFKTATLAKKDTMQIVSKSKCVLDSPQDNQDGATIRVIESLAAKTKLITTNKDLVNYDFYNPKNIYIYDGEFDFTDEFFTSEYQDLPDEIYQKYSLRGFLKQIFEIKE